ncbi:hypothetical protein FHS56_001222 [Thermonema lapsum]|uniref:Uncharacterized protein n=1 Tax=Thermonema lapsum TaxID=28195 RepID=A0A846MQH4_9BACT|nr:hypothetical protein [Thermonema lapsum]
MIKQKGASAPFFVKLLVLALSFQVLAGNFIAACGLT